MTPEQKRLAESNHNLIYAFLKRYGLSIEDYYDLAAIGLCRAAINFKDGMSSFSTYAYRCMFTTVMMDKRKERQPSSIPEYKLFYYQSEFDVSNGEGEISFIDTVPSKESTENEALANAIFQDFMDTLKPRDKVVFQMLMDGRKQVEISKALGTSRSLTTKIMKKLKIYLNE